MRTAYLPLTETLDLQTSPEPVYFAIAHGVGGRPLTIPIAAAFLDLRPMEAHEGHVVR
jgi:hypothetical protein